MNTLDDLLAPTTRRLRTLDGPLQGTTHPLPDRFLIGRGMAADLQLFDERVSREHAEVVLGPGGRHWLVDLGSRNGTFTEGRRIGRTELELNTTFTIAGTRFMYEEEISTDGIDADDESFVVSDGDSPRGRGTIEYDVDQVPWSMPAVRARETAQGRSAPRYQGQALGPDGQPYPGNIVEDVALLHTLKNRASRNALRSTAELDRLEELRVLLGPRIEPEGRLVEPRFSCCFPATLRLPSGQRMVVTMSELGAGAARVRCGPVEPNTLAWLTIELVTGARTQTLMFPCLVLQAREGFVELSFMHRKERACLQTHSHYEHQPATNGHPQAS